METTANCRRDEGEVGMDRKRLSRELQRLSPLSAIKRAGRGWNLTAFDICIHHHHLHISNDEINNTNLNLSPQSEDMQFSSIVSLPRTCLSTSGRHSSDQESLERSE